MPPATSAQPRQTITPPDLRTASADRLHTPRDSQFCRGFTLAGVRWSAPPPKLVGSTLLWAARPLRSRSRRQTRTGRPCGLAAVSSAPPVGRPVGRQPRSASLHSCPARYAPLGPACPFPPLPPQRRTCSGPGGRGRRLSAPPPSPCTAGAICKPTTADPQRRTARQVPPPAARPPHGSAQVSRFASSKGLSVRRASLSSRPPLLAQKTKRQTPYLSLSHYRLTRFCTAAEGSSEASSSADVIGTHAPASPVINLTARIRPNVHTRPVITGMSRASLTTPDRTATPLSSTIFFTWRLGGAGCPENFLKSPAERPIGGEHGRL